VPKSPPGLHLSSDFLRRKSMNDRRKASIITLRMALPCLTARMALIATLRRVKVYVNGERDSLLCDHRTSLDKHSNMCLRRPADRYRWRLVLSNSGLLLNPLVFFRSTEMNELAYPARGHVPPQNNLSIPHFPAWKRLELR